MTKMLCHVLSCKKKANHISFAQRGLLKVMDPTEINDGNVMECEKQWKEIDIPEP